MEENYWNQFLKTGSIKDYLSYRNAAGCGREQRSRKGEREVESDHGDWHGAVGGTDRRV